MKKHYISKDKTDWYFVMVLLLMGTLGFLHAWANRTYNDKMDVLETKIKNEERRLDALYDVVLPLPTRRVEYE